MGRELRRVPPDWQHPSKPDGRYIPMFGRPYRVAYGEWLKDKEAFLRGEWGGKPLPEDAHQYTYEQWSGEAPDPDDYFPDWPESSCTHFQMYENTSEGTPISPIFDDPEKVAQWCADNEVSAFGSLPGDLQYWRAVIAGQAGFGLLVSAIETNPF